MDTTTSELTRSAVRTCLTVIGIAFCAGWATVAAAAVPTPTVTAVPAGKPGAAEHNYPFFSTDIVLSNYGYVEHEFFYDGKANTYNSPTPGSNAEIVTSGTPYRSRLLVRRPAQQSRFNGIVIVEWSNVSNGYDTDVLWLYQKEFLIREGYAWVGVSAQDVGVSRPPNGLKVWSPTRYGTEGYTLGSDPRAKKKFAAAAAALQSYINMTRQLQGRGNMPPETASLLVNEATTLQKLVKTLAS